MLAVILRISVSLAAVPQADPAPLGPTPRHTAQLGLRVPAGFEVKQFAGNELASDIYSMTVDPKGRIVVAGRGYIRTLVDDDGDGVADRAIEFADSPKDGAMGLAWHATPRGASLYCVGDGGLRRFVDADGDGRADVPSELLLKLKTGGEHDAHDIKFDPYASLYVLCGNMTGIDRSFARSPTSPIKEPVAGCVIRCGLNGQPIEIIADGFRNAYRMDWNLDGELMTFDSDNERCVSLPWYEPTRFYHVIRGGHYGWLAPQRAETFRLPPYLPDVVAPVATLGRGSPTGVTCYRGEQFPASYRGGFFLADWTFGRIYFAPLGHTDGRYTSEPRVFLESVGDNGFAPTDMLVHPTTGELFISIGGRGTRGAVYRVRYTGPPSPATPKSESPPPLNRSTQKAERPKSRSFLDEPQYLISQLHQIRWRLDEAAAQRERPSRYPPQTPSVLSSLDRRTMKASFGHSNRQVRREAVAVIAAMDDDDSAKLIDDAVTPREGLTWCLGAFAAHPSEATALATTVLENNLPPDEQLDAVRIFQLAWGDLGAASVKGSVWEGFTPQRRPPRVAGKVAVPWGSGEVPASDVDQERFTAAIRAVRELFPTGHADLDRELSRTLAMVADDDAVTREKVAAQLTDDSSPIDDVHFLAVFARLRGPRGEDATRTVARALARLDRKMVERKLNRDRNWPLRVAEIHSELAAKDAKLNAAILGDGEFGRADHVLFAQCHGFDRHRAAEVFFARPRADVEFAWSPALVELIGSLPDLAALDAIRARWDEFALRDAILAVLARDPQPADRDKFVESLASAQLATVRAGIDALGKLADVDAALREPAAWVPLIRAMRRLRDGREETQLQARVGRLLATLTGRKDLIDEDAADANGWSEWFSREHPDLAVKLVGPDGVDRALWNRRLAAVDWSAGDADRGRFVYSKTGCAACHSGGRALGPDLRGVANRFSRADLFTAILEPSRDVSPRYQTTLVATEDGKLHQGSVIYEAVDSLILQTGPDAVVRIDAAQIASRRTSPVSMMPAGLIDKLTDAEIADLYAHLRSLR